MVSTHTNNVGSPGHNPQAFYRVSTISHRIFETKSSFHVKQRTAGEVSLLFFGSSLTALTKCSFLQEGWALGYHSAKFTRFPNISKFPKILSLKSFGNS